MVLQQLSSADVKLTNLLLTNCLETIFVNNRDFWLFLIRFTRRLPLLTHFAPSTLWKTRNVLILKRCFWVLTLNLIVLKWGNFPLNEVIILLTILSLFWKFWFKHRMIVFLSSFDSIAFYLLKFHWIFFLLKKKMILL